MLLLPLLLLTLCWTLMAAAPPTSPGEVMGQPVGVRAAAAAGGAGAAIHEALETAATALMILQDAARADEMTGMQTQSGVISKSREV
jgi:hypothetical protein